MMIAAMAAAAFTVSACDRPEPAGSQATNATRGTEIARPIDKSADSTMNKSADSAMNKSADSAMNKSADASSTMAPAAGGDSAITDKVTTALKSDPTLKAADIKVDTKEGTVTLTGTVDTTDMRMHAHQLAATTPGVASVIDNLSVKNAG
jgi:hyperosmotically inducible protein